MNRLFHILFSTLLVCLSLSKAEGQNYPIQVTPIVRGTDIRGNTDMRWSTFYSDPDKLKVRVVHKDKDVGTVGIFFKIKIERAGISIRSREDLLPPQVQPINMNFGQILDFTGTQLVDYFRPENLVVQGLPPEFLYQGGTLPDGFYMVSVTAYEYDATRGHRQLSNTGISSFAVFKGLPPIIQFPKDGQVFTEMAVQNVLFQWLPRTFSAPGAGGLSYKVELFVIDEGINPQEAANSSQALFTAMTSATSLPYGPGYPGFVPLQVGKQYALRVQVVSTDAGQQFANDGKSQVVSFSYGHSCVPPVNVSMAASDNFWDKLSWTPVAGAESYRVRFTSRVTGITDSTEVYGSYYDLYNPNRRDTLTYSIVSLCSAGRRSSEVTAERPTERNLRAAAKVLSGGVPPTPQTSLEDILNPFDIPVNSGGKTDADVAMHFAQIKNPFPDITNPCGTTKIDATDCDPHLSELKTGSERFNIVAGKYMYLNGYEILITSANEGLLYLPLIQSRIPVEWSGLTVMASENGIYGCVTEGEARMQGSVTGAIGRDLHRQVMALLTQGPGSFSGKFGEALEKISAIGDSLKNGQTVNWGYTKGVLDAAKTGYEEWKTQVNSYYSQKGETVPPGVASVLSQMQTKQDKYQQLSDCVVQNIPQGATGDAAPKRLLQAIFLCNLSEEDKSEMSSSTPEAARINNLLEEAMLQPVYEDLAAGQVNSNDPPDYVAYYTPSGKLVVLPKEAKPYFGTSTDLPIPESALVGFELDGKKYMARYDPSGEGYIFKGYIHKSSTTVLGYSFSNTVTYEFPLTRQDVENTTSFVSVPLVIGYGGAASLTYAEGAGALGLSSAGLVALAVGASGILLKGDTNPRNYGEGPIDMTLPMLALGLKAITDIPATLPRTIDHAEPSDIGNCHVYVIWGPNFNKGGDIDVAKYGMTCQDDCNARPEEQRRAFNREHGVESFWYTFLFKNKSKPIAHLLEKSLTATYILANGGDLPPKHNLPCFKKDDPFNIIETLLKRKERAEKWNTDNRNTYGTK